jgi:peptidoglycan/xylan/chitin deacetylase (PgdA/CDA1 family)
MVRVDYSVRIDDIFNRGHAARPRECGGLLSVAEGFGARVILNVIPRRLIESPNEGGAMVAELRDALDRGHEVIQHGYDHCCGQCGASSHQTYCELLGRDQPLELMLRDIGKGKEMLEAAIGRRVVVYGPTGVDVHTEQLLHAVRLLGFVATTGVPTELHARMGLKVVPTGSDYAWGAKTEGEFGEATRELRGEFDAVVKSARESGEVGYFQILLHDPFTRASYEGGATLRYLREMLEYMKSVGGVELRNVISTDVLGMSAEDLKFGEPVYPKVHELAERQGS